jgi:hypothetical protein
MEETCNRCDCEIGDLGGDYINSEEQTDGRDEFWCQDCVDMYGLN